MGFTLHPWIQQILAHGYRIPLLSPPPLQIPSTSPRSPTSNSTSTLQVIDQEITTLLQKQAIEPVLSSTPGFQSTLFVIPKKDGGLRPVLNLKPLNQHLPVQHFKMETMKTITQLLQPGDYLTSIDLKDAFHHIAIHPASRHLLRFQWRNQLYQYRVLPFGLSLSPLVFTKVLKPVLKWACRQGIRISSYLDDLLIMGKTYQATKIATQKVCQKMQELGWLLNLKKSSLIPSQQISHLGFIIDTSKMMISIPGKKIRNLRRMAYSLLKQKTTSWTTLAQFIGTALATQLGNQQARFRTRHLLAQLNQTRYQPTTPLLPLMRQELTWWISQLSKWNGQHLLNQVPTMQIFTDASDNGYGIVWNDQLYQGKWTATEQSFHINYKELLAVQRIFHHIQVPPNSHLQLVARAFRHQNLLFNYASLIGLYFGFHKTLEFSFWNLS